MTHEAVLRFSIFLGALLVMAALEAWLPRRDRALPRAKRWPSNLGIVVLDTLVVRVLFPAGAVGAAMMAQGHGLLALLGRPFWLQVLLAVVALDLIIYAQHVLFHHVPWLWRLHRMHHADTDIDATTGLRFHPLEIVLSMIIKIGAVVALGAPPLAVVIFEVVLNASSMFNHANLKLPLWLDASLRWLIVTPDMHRVHHSVVRAETDSNFGFNLSLWDRLFRTYTAQPEAGHEGAVIGLPVFREAEEARLDRMLTQPFREGGAVPKR